MNEQITLQEVRAKKSIMETEILLALKKFNEATGLSVESISISTVQYVNPTVHKLSTSVSCQIEIT